MNCFVCRFTYYWCEFAWSNCCYVENLITHSRRSICKWPEAVGRHDAVAFLCIDEPTYEAVFRALDIKPNMMVDLAPFGPGRSAAKRCSAGHPYVRGQYAQVSRPYIYLDK